MAPTALMVFVALMVASANGANDNFKGVATLLGGGTLSYRRALMLATVATLAGSLASVYLASALIKAFHGSGLVAAGLAADPKFIIAIGAGAGLTVLIATRIGMPISTTHGLLGAMIGAAIAGGSTLHWETLMMSFIAPLLVSPLLVIPIATVCYLGLDMVRNRMTARRDACLCVGEEIVPVAVGAGSVAQGRSLFSAKIGATAKCHELYSARVAEVSVGGALDVAHMLSAASVSLARGVNDTPKIAALLVVLPLFGASASTTLVALGMALGALIGAARVARTMSYEITELDPCGGLASNLATTAVVMMASVWGLPVSTTHVSCGALFATGVVRGEARRRALGAIVLSWLLTLPCAAVLGSIIFALAT